MALLNYTTQIEAIKTVSEIMGILVAHGAREVLTQYDDDHRIQALLFNVRTPQGECEFKLPVDAEATLQVLQRQRVPGRYLNHAQAVRVAWRIVKDWVEAQMALLETEMVKLEQIFLPYMVTPQGNTLYEAIRDRYFLLPEGRDD